MIEESPKLEEESRPGEESPAPAISPVWKTGRKKGRSRFRKRISRNFGYFCLRSAHAVISRLPWAAGRGLSWLLGSCAYLLLKRERDIALQSLKRVYSAEKSPAQIRALVRSVFRHTASTVIDWVILRRWPREKLEARFPEVVAKVREATKAVKELSGSGVVALTAHLGNWELLALFFSHFAPGVLTGVAKRLYFEKYNSFLHNLRTEFGLEIIYSDESARKMFRAVKSGKVLTLLCDQDLRTNSGVFVKFFGLPAYTVTFPVDIARMAGVRMAFCALVTERRTFRVLYTAPYEIPHTGDEAGDVLWATQRWTSILEEEIRKYPEQWSWIHPRWRSTPERPRLPFDSKRRIEKDA